MTEGGPLPVLQMIRRNTLTLGSIERHSSISYEIPKTFQSRKPQANKILGLLFDSKSYLAHRKNILAAQAVVDDKPPRIGLDTALNFKKFPVKISEQARLQEENKKLLQALNEVDRSKKSVYQRQDMLQDYKLKEKQRRAMSKYPPYWERQQTGLGIKRQLSITGMDTSLTRIKGSKYYKSHQRPRCFLEFTAGNDYLGKIVVELYYDYVPVTVENFMYLCYDISSGQIPMKEKMAIKNSNGKLKDVKMNNYKGCLVHRIMPGYYIQSGDVVNKSGAGGHSIYGPVFPDENFKLKHSQRGVLSMANKGPNTNNSQFMITLKELKTLDGTQVVFGRVVQGFKTLDKIEDFGTKSGSPRTQVKISQCGIIDFKKYFRLA